MTRASVGWVEPLSIVTVRARVEGEVLEQHITDGQLVAKGDLLFRIDDREIRAQIAKDQAMLDRDQATLARAQADLQRARDLLQKHVAAQQQVDQTEADAKIAAANSRPTRQRWTTIASGWISAWYGHPSKAGPVPSG